ncbi:MAG: NUDIX domain-containing protein, partial [Pseudomonadota bacterium]
MDLRRGEASDRAPGALIFATDPDNRVLLQLRDDRPGVNWGGYWGLFGGGLEPHDADLSHAAQREFH